MCVLMYSLMYSLTVYSLIICLTYNAPVYLCDPVNAVPEVLFYGTRINVKGNVCVRNVQREVSKQSLLYMGPVMWEVYLPF